LIAQLESVGKNAPKDDSSRKKLYDAARSLTIDLELPGDTIQRIAYQPAEITAVHIGSDLGLFKLLAASDGSSMSIKELVDKTNADYLLLGTAFIALLSSLMHPVRLIIKEVGEDLYAASHITKTLAIPGLMAGVLHNWQALPKFLADTNYRNPSDPAHCAFQPGHNTDEVPFLWVLSRPTNFANFNLWMSASREGQQIWLDVFPFEETLCHHLNPDTPLFVDVGGGLGHQCQALKARYPNIPGRVILQDLPQTIQQAIPTDGVEVMPYDFWTPQPIKGARAYYMRNIMHDYPDEKCITILHNIMAAMDKDSVILIDDMILPNEKAPWRATQLDLLVMSALAAMERSEKQ
ncbi:MAG: hypothetical protein Q9187_009536, partial [Circinaria calcarea]